MKKKSLQITNDLLISTTTTKTKRVSNTIQRLIKLIKP